MRNSEACDYQEWMAVQTLLSFSQSASCKPHNQPVTSSSHRSIKTTRGQDDEMFDWNRAVQPLTPPPSDAGSMSPMSDSICEDSVVDTSFHDHCDIDEIPEKSSSLLKEVTIYVQLFIL